MGNLQVFQQEKTLQKLQPKIRYLGKRLGDFWELRHVGDIRQAGVMVGIELVLDRESKSSFPTELRVGHQVILEACRRGVILRPLGDVIVLMPPLSISQVELKTLLDVAYESIKAVTEGKQTTGNKRK